MAKGLWGEGTLQHGSWEVRQRSGVFILCKVFVQWHVSGLRRQFSLQTLFSWQAKCQMCQASSKQPNEEPQLPKIGRVQVKWR